MVRGAGAAAAAAAAVLVAAGAGGGATSLRTATVACTTRSFDVSFRPKYHVVVTSGGTELGRASFTTRRLTGVCPRVHEPRNYADGGLGAEIRRRVVLHCTAPRPIRVHVNSIINGDTGAIVGSNLSVGVGDPLRVIMSAILKNKGDPYASRIYRAKRYCRLG
jgi:hypothetical protein